MNGVLVVATDGLWKYAPHGRIREMALAPSVPEASALLALARLSNGDLPDDAAIIVAAG